MLEPVTAGFLDALAGGEDGVINQDTVMGDANIGIMVVCSANGV